MNPLSSKEAASVMEAFEQIRLEYSEHFSEVFKTIEEISNIEVWCNSLPRRTLGYRTPDEVFEAELDQIYQAT
jgi:IS30 family transposase